MGVANLRFLNKNGLYINGVYINSLYINLNRKFRHNQRRVLELIGLKCQVAKLQIRTKTILNRKEIKLKSFKITKDLIDITLIIRGEYSIDLEKEHKNKYHIFNEQSLNTVLFTTARSLLIYINYA